MQVDRKFLHLFYHQVHQNVAKGLGVENHEWKSTAELADDIRKLNSSVAALLGKFIDTYESWFALHLNIDETGAAGNLSAEQNQRLIAAIEQRDHTRQALIDGVKKFQRPQAI